MRLANTFTLRFEVFDNEAQLPSGCIVLSYVPGDDIYGAAVLDRSRRDELESASQSTATSCGQHTPSSTSDDAYEEDDVSDEEDDSSDEYDISTFPKLDRPVLRVPLALARYLDDATRAALDAFWRSLQAAPPRALHRRSLACPFWVRSLAPRPPPQTCLGHYTMHGLRMHLGSAHRRAIDCPICGARFPTRLESDDHIRQRTCEMMTEPCVEGVTDTQLIRLAKRDDPRLSEADQWASVWRILFQAEEPPARARWEPMASAADFVRDFWDREGARVLDGFVSQNRLAKEVEGAGGASGLVSFAAAVLDQMADAVLRSI